jgi:hypothetical protein
VREYAEYFSNAIHPNCDCAVYPILKDHDEFLEELEDFVLGRDTEGAAEIDEWAHKYRVIEGIETTGGILTDVESAANLGAAFSPAVNPATGAVGPHPATVAQSWYVVNKLFPNEEWLQTVDGEYVGDYLYLAKSRIPTDTNRQSDEWLKLRKEISQSKMIISVEGSVVHLVPENNIARNIRKFDTVTNGSPLELKTVNGFLGMRDQFVNSRGQAKNANIRGTGFLSEKSVVDGLVDKIVYSVKEGKVKLEDFDYGVVTVYLEKNSKILAFEIRDLARRAKKILGTT